METHSTRVCLLFLELSVTVNEKGSEGFKMYTVPFFVRCSVSCILQALERNLSALERAAWVCSSAAIFPLHEGIPDSWQAQEEWWLN